ncbi:Hypothetical predicted protein [Cloeon dipterum]|uniref:Uncharacterized protein n=1 Tax=Cloeon dipterum TaxID=197152 RepID=A0A8S1DT22_9INSE|nr:Hypothetical predicted protein [Cloeon dipterum]
MKSEYMESHPVPTPTGTSTKIATPTEVQQKGSFQFDELHLLLICLVLALGSIIIWLILKLMKNNSIANHHGQQLEMAVVNIGPSDDYQNLPTAPANDDGVHNASGEYQEIPDDSDDVILPLQPAERNNDILALSPALPPRNVVHAEMQPALPARNVVHAKILPPLPSIRNDENAAHGQQLEMAVVNIGPSDDYLKLRAAPANDDGVHNTSGEYQEIPHDSDDVILPLQPAGTSDDKVVLSPALPPRNVVHAKILPALPSIRNDENADQGQELEMSAVNVESSDVEIPAAPANDGDGTNPPMQPTDHYLLMHPILPTSNVVHAEMNDSNIALAEPAPLPPLLPRIRSLPRANLASGPVAEPGSSGVSQQIPAAPAAKEYVYEDMRAPLILEVSSSEERLAEEDAVPVAGPEPLHLNGRPPTQDGLEMSAVNYESSDVSQEIPAAPANDGDGTNPPMQPADYYLLMHPILPTINVVHAEMDDSNIAPAKPAPLPPLLPRIRSLPRANLASGPIAEPGSSGVNQQIPAAPAAKEYVYEDMRAPVILEVSSSEERLAEEDAAPVAGPEPLHLNGRPPTQDGLEMAAVNYESSDVSQEIPAAPANDGDNPPLQPADHYLLMHPILPTNNVMHAEMDDSNIAPAEPAPLPPLLPRIRSLPRVNLASGPVAEPGSSGVSQQIPAAPAAKEYVYEDMRAPVILEVSSSEERLAEEDAAPVAGPEPLHLNGRPPTQDGLEMAAVNYESSGACQEIPAAPAEPANDGDGAKLPLQPTERNNENVPLSLALPITRNGENAEMDDSNVVPAEPAPLPPDRPEISSPPRANLAQAACAPVAEPEPLKQNGKPPSQEGLVKEEDEQTHH